MNDNREKLLQQMDMELARQKDRIEAIQDKETKKDLENIAQAVEDLYLKIQMDDGLKIRTANKRMNSFYSSLVNIFKGKYLRNMLLTFIAGLMVALIPTLIYINSMKEDNLTFQFVPNAIAERKPIFLQMIDTQEKLDAVNTANIYKPDTVTLGSGIGLISKEGLVVYLKRELESSWSHLKYIGPQEKEKVIINGYTYIPDTILTRDPSAVQILENQDMVETAKKWKQLTYKEFLELGGAIDCPSTVPCYVISKSAVQERLIIKPFKSSKPK